MTYDEIKEILSNSTQDDWLIFDEEGTFTYKEDVNLHIERKEIDFERDKFETEDWATDHPDPEAYKREFKVKYNNSLISVKTLVSVDGGRALLPLPDLSTMGVKPEDYNFAKIVDLHREVDKYLKSSGLHVEN